MKIKLWIVFYIAFLSTTIAQTKDSSSLLYKISGKGITQPSYIFGTFHLMCEGDFEITPAFEKAINSTKQLYGELKMDDPTMLLKTMTLMKSDSSLKELLGEEKYKIFDEKCRAITGIGAMMYNNFKPMMVTSAISFKMIDCEKSVQPESEIMKIAKKNNATVYGLETIEMQLESFNTTPLKKQAEEVYRMAYNLDSSKQMMKSLLSTYKKRNIQLIYQFMKDIGTSDEFENNLLTKRNKNWIPIMEKTMAEMPTFFAVGAGHLGGENGVINLLEKLGYTLEPIKY